MDFSTLLNHPVIDGHIHYGHPAFIKSLMEVMDASLTDRLNVVCTPDEQRLSLVPDALHLKAHYPDRVYVFGGLDISSLFITPAEAGTHFANYVDTLLGMGCDGIKMIEGKPQIRKMLPLPPFDSDIYAPYWAKMADGQVPLIFHVNDPEEFWDADRVPSWARDAGWFYGDGSYIDNEVQYTEVLNVLERHPDLTVIFAHFFFFSAQLERLGEMLDRFPNMHVDLVPGIEMYWNFAKDPDTVRDFFLKYQDRIIYGTDIGAKALLSTPEEGVEMEESLDRTSLVRQFLEVDGEFSLNADSGFLFGRLDKPFYGINLPEDVLRKIYSGNFERLAGPKPRPLNPPAIIAECTRLSFVIEAMAPTLPGGKSDNTIAKMVAEFFQKSG